MESYSMDSVQDAVRTALFQNQRYQILSNCIHLFGASILAFCFARRTEGEHLSSRRGWAELTWAKILILGLFLDSWFFLALTGVLVHGIGISFSLGICSLGIFSCIIFYASSKALIYLFLAERVWIVWRPLPSSKRLKSPVFGACISVVVGYVMIIGLMVFGRISIIRPDGVCVIGLRNYATISLVVYDLIVNCFLTFMFVYPLLKHRVVSSGLRRLAIRTLVAATVALISSSVNFIILIALKGTQLGWVCLGSCGADVTVNAVVLYWVTASKHHESTSRSLTLPSPIRRFLRRDHRETAVLGGNMRSPAMSTDDIHIPELLQGTSGTAESLGCPPTPLDADGRDSFKKYLDDSYEKMHGGSSVGVVSEPSRVYSSPTEWTSRSREPGRFARTAGSVFNFPRHGTARMQTQSVQNGIAVTIDVEKDFDEALEFRA